VNLLQLATRSVVSRIGMRSLVGEEYLTGGFGWGDFMSAFQTGVTQTLIGNREEMDGSYVSLAAGAYRGNGAVFACMLARLLLFSEARFQFQQLRGGRPGDLFGTPDLRILEEPEPGKTTGDLLAKAIVDADLAGNGFLVRRPGRIKRLRPDWTAIVLGSNSERNPKLDPNDVDAEMAGLLYWPGGMGHGTLETYLREEVVHFAPIPDPLAHYRGMSWLTPIIREILADSAATSHKLNFFLNGATPSTIIKTPVSDPDKFADWIKVFESRHKGVRDAYKAMYLGAGQDVTVVGTNLQQMDFKVTQGAGETRIAAASGIHPTVVGLSEGLQGSSLNAGNFPSAKRLTADKTLRPLWRNLAGSLQVIVPPPPGSRLWYDDRDIPFLREDVKDAVDALFVQAQAMRQLGDGGWEHDAVVDAVTSGDLRRLSGQHTGLVPVQLQAPGAQAFAAGRSFWPSSGDWVGSEITRGDLFAPDHPLVAAFPSLFEPIAECEPWAIRSWSPRPQLTAELVAIPDSDLEIRVRALELSGRSQMPSLTVNTPDVHMTAPVVNVTMPDITVNTPAVTVDPTPVIVENQVEPTPVETA